MPLPKNIGFVNKIILENAISCVIIIIEKISSYLYIEEDELWENLHFLGKAF